MLYYYNYVENDEDKTSINPELEKFNLKGFERKTITFIKTNSHPWNFNCAIV